MNIHKLKPVVPYLGIPVLGLALWLIHGPEYDAFTLLAYELLVGFGYVAALSDLRSKRIPNEYIVAMFAAWIMIMVPQLFVNTESALSSLKNAIAGFGLGGGLFLLVYLISRKGLGGGDVKLMAAFGLYLGFGNVLPAMLYGSILSALTALILVLLKRIGRKDAIPLAPFLYIGVLLTIFFM